MRRPEAKKPPERPLLSAETGNVENRRQDPGRNGLFIDRRRFPRFGKTGWWGVQSYAEPVSKGATQNRHNREKYREKTQIYAQIGDHILKGPVSIGVSESKTTKPLSGKKISRTGKLRKITGKKYSIGQFGAFGPSHVTMHN